MYKSIVTAIVITLTANSNISYASQIEWECVSVTGMWQNYAPEGTKTIIGNPVESFITEEVSSGNFKLNFVIDTETLEGVRGNGIAYYPILHNPQHGVIMLMNNHPDVRRVISLYYNLNVFSYVEMQPTVSANIPEMRSFMGDCVVTPK